jgi:hypothetical protein
LFRTAFARQRQGGSSALSDSIESAVASARRADQRFQRLERRAERAVTALRATLGEKGSRAAAGLLDEAAEAHLELIRTKEAALEAQRLLADRVEGRAAERPQAAVSSSVLVSPLDSKTFARRGRA